MEKIKTKEDEGEEKEKIRRKCINEKKGKGRRTRT